MLKQLYILTLTVLLAFAQPALAQTSKIEQQKKVIANLERSIAREEKQLAQLKKNKASAEKQVASLTKQIEKRNALIRETTRQIKQLTAEVNTPVPIVCAIKEAFPDLSILTEVYDIV